MNGLIYNIVDHTSVTGIGGCCCGHGWRNRGNHYIW